MTRSMYLSIAGLATSVTVTGLILVPLFVIALPVVMARPSLLDGVFASTNAKIAEVGTRMMMRTMKGFTA